MPDFPFPLLLEVEAGTEDVSPLRQIVFDGGLTGVHPVAITDRMRDDVELLRDYLIERARAERREAPTAHSVRHSHPGHGRALSRGRQDRVPSTRAASAVRSA
jgi:hypothetical protein